ncbi:MAG: hypothetical protein ABIC91_03740 [Nanoarchaeota archaeon]|nr:hypothetical protein [Nanoarchaeota archaeon]MBU1031151.1 hypothetical protein [Nanoarchaeota archaeon]MBU1850407.1 hypothetical protein [Nanoarchaeota archaeon]
MVLIKIKISRKKRCFILIPERVLDNMLDRHVDRVGLAERYNTCLVCKKHGAWYKRPTHRQVVELLLESLEHFNICAGERHYSIPHHLFLHIKCRNFLPDGYPATDAEDGYFKINFKKINGGGPLALKEVRKYGEIHNREANKITNTLKKDYLLYDDSVWLVHHITPAIR